MQYRTDQYADYGEQEIALRRQLSNQIGRVGEMEQRYLSEMLSDNGGAGFGALAYSSQILAGDGSAAARDGRYINEYFGKNRRTAATDAFDSGPTAKRIRGLNEVGMGESNVYRQQQQYGQQSQPLETYSSYGGGSGLDYGQLADAERELDHQSARMVDEQHFQQRSGMSDSRLWRMQQWQQYSESIAAAELRSLMNARWANFDEMMASRRIAQAANSGFGVVNAEVLAPCTNGGPKLGPEPQGFRQIQMEKRKERKRRGPQPLIHSAKPNEAFFTDVRKRSLGGGGQLIKSHIPMEMMPMLNPMKLPAFATQNRMFAALQPQTRVKPAPTNVPSRKVYSKKEKEELETRRNAPKLRELLAAPENAEIWVETHTNEVPKTKQKNINKEKTVEVGYFFNAITGETVYHEPKNPTKDGLPVHIVKHEELAKVLAKTVPQTIILKRAKVANGLTDAMLRKYFEKFGKVALAKVVKVSKRSGGRKSALIRMSTIDGQEKVLACKEHIINQQPTEAMICQNRLFISRLPDNCLPSQIMLFLAEQARMLDADKAPAAVDIYWCTPFPQFCFATFGGRLVTNKLYQASDLLYKERFYLNLCVVGIDLNAETNEVFTRKLEEFTEKANSNRKMRQMVKALNFVSETVKQTLEFISDFSEQNYDSFTLRSILAHLNSTFARCTDEETRNYHTAMELILEMCLDLAKKLGILTNPAEFDSYVAAGDLLNQSSKTNGDDGGDDDAIENDATADGTDGGEGGAEGEGEGDGTRIEPENLQESEEMVEMETTKPAPQQ